MHFMGTGISLFQFPTRADPGESRAATTSPSRTKQHNLPNSYAVVPAVALKTSSVDVPVLSTNTTSVQSLPTCLEEDVSDHATNMQLLQSCIEEPLQTCLEEVLQTSLEETLHCLEEDVPLLSTPMTLQTCLDEAKSKEQNWQSLRKGKLPVKML